MIAAMPWAPGARLLGVGAFLAAVGILASAAGWDPRVTVSVARLGLFDPPNDVFAAVMFHYATLPRIAVALLAGASLGLAGAAMQAVLRNPLASPTTLGVASGASFALALSTLAGSAAAFLPPEAWSFLGAMGAGGLVYLIGRRHRFDPARVALSGMAVGLFLSAAASGLVLFNGQQLAFLFLWGSGHLAQSDWSGPAVLLPAFALAAAALLAARRVIGILAVGDDVAGSVGLKTETARLLVLVVAVALTAAVVARVGIVGFVGLAIPAIVRLCRPRSVAATLVASAGLGALALFAADASAQLLSRSGDRLVPAGAVTALFGAPVLFALLSRSRLSSRPNPPLRRSAGSFRDAGPALFAALAAGLAFAILVALFLGRTGGGFELLDPARDGTLLLTRLPRVLGALTAGAAVALSGLLVQKIVGNDLASPELLGISSGAAAALVLAVLVLGVISRTALLLCGFGGAIGATALVLWFARRHRDQIAAVLLAGIALGVFLDAIVRIALANASLEATALLAWLSGSTVLVSLPEAIGLGLLLAAAAGMVLLCRRPIALLDLGAAVPQALGLRVRAAQTLTLLLSALLASASTMVIGPLSFVGLVAPHLVRMAGVRRLAPQVGATLLAGALLMVVADWLGRVAVTPWQVPGGLVAGLFGSLCFLILAARRGAGGHAA
ncbi:Fe(3+)-hydroxamate ABC transporter permease FhuB [Jiella sonneratiae]|uniref:Fe(3+)-hydroxamate ABC transporter permease FhuB n=1 Tax=Jiella sonneratiae TaxID=2816856 RepID=A0ABS3J0E5_9HYPH|nr:Fe(3+)-hydroxamate ABC transporter permease FhuB [Jiella sonneratiae]MBO0903132.1 Fe(3+)-hydroxamate ABC transporter permease FhuB [Jiella sonneratiae]